MMIIGIHQRLREIPYSPAVDKERAKLVSELDDILQWYLREVRGGFEKKFRVYLNIGDIDP